MSAHTSPNRYVDQHLLAAVPTAESNTHVREIVGHLTDKKHGFASIGYIYVVEEKKLVGVLSIKELLQAPADQKISELMARQLVTVHPQATIERAAITAIQHGIKAVPVVDHGGVFLGVVGTDTILHTLHHEHVEDLLKMGGIQITAQKHILEMLTDRISHLIRIRFPWLFVGLVGGFIATLVVRSFEQTLMEQVALAFFMPAIVYMASAVGAQTQTLFIRAEAIKKIGVARYIGREIIVDGILGILLALAMYVFTYVSSQQFEIALTVSLAMLLTIFSAGLVAVVIPWLLIRFKRDPAIGSGPFGTVIQDILSLVVYFLVASVLL